MRIVEFVTVVTNGINARHPTQTVDEHAMVMLSLDRCATAGE
jgi:hypothetical protein